MRRYITRRDFLSKTVTAAAVTAIGFHAFLSPTAFAIAQKIHHIDIKDLEFSPAELLVRPGDRIIWTNQDIAPHTITAIDKSWDSQKIARNKEWYIDVTADMSTSYYCRYHPKMKAKLIIATV